MGTPPGRRTVFRGKIIEVGVDTVDLPNGARVELEIIRHPGGAAVVAISRRREVCLLRQYRHAAGGWLWELPAGKIDRREPPLETARRELAEEAQLGARRGESLGQLISSPGVFTERIFLYLARDLEPAAGETEAGEVIEVHWVPFESAVERANRGDIFDSKTVAGLFRAAAAMSAGGEDPAPGPDRGEPG